MNQGHVPGMLQNHLLEVDAKHAPGPTWETVRYMVAAIQYGGRITDEFDKLLMQTYAERYFHQVALPADPACFQDHQSFTFAKILLPMP